jgi:hypothetical protein
MRVRFMNPEQRLLKAIADKRQTRDDVAVTYAYALRGDHEQVDWAKVNVAIMERWSLNALRYIKREAWALVGERVRT